MVLVFILWVFRWSINWFDISWNDSENNISRSNFLVFSLICLSRRWESFLLSGSFFVFPNPHVISIVLYLLSKYSSSIASGRPNIFQKILLRSLFLRNIAIHQKRSSPWMVLCLLVKASVFACVMHELELLVRSVFIPDNIRSLSYIKIKCLYSIFLRGKFNRTKLFLMLRCDFKGIHIILLYCVIPVPPCGINSSGNLYEATPQLHAGRAWIPAVRLDVWMTWCSVWIPISWRASGIVC